MAKKDHLDKERELELGGIIQAGARSFEALQDADLTPTTRAAHEAAVRDGERAIDELVKANIGLVHHAARKFKSKFPGAPELEDLVSMGSIGLMTAVHKYDPARGNKFSTLAFYWVTQAIRRETNKTGRLVRLPENRISDYSHMNKVANRYEESDASSAEVDAHIMDELKLKKVELMNIRNAAATHSSLNRKVGGGDEGSSKELGDLVAEANPSQGTEFSVMTSECYAILQEEISALPGIGREAVSAQFSLPLDGTYPTTKDVSEKHGLTPSRFRRVVKESLQVLRTSLSARDLHLPDFLDLEGK